MSEAPGSADIQQSSLLFRLGSQRYALQADHVVEVIRTPGVTRVPHGPPSLAGVANLRGLPLPVVSLQRLLNLEASPEAGLASRVIVYSNGHRVGLMVDEILKFGSTAEGSLLLNLDATLEGAFKSDRTRPSRPSTAAASGQAGASDTEELLSFLSFRIAGQIYAFPLESVHEVLALPEGLVPPVGSDAAILGVTLLRDKLLPVVSLAGLLALTPSSHRQRIVVVEWNGASLGLAVDKMDALHRLPLSAIDPVPTVLKRGGGSAEIEALARIDKGRTLVSILSAEKLFGHQAVGTIIEQNHGAVSMPSHATKREAREQFLVFRLGEETYGLPIGAVDEVIRVPDALTRLPNAPAFVSGVMNLRGKPLPLIDQRTRFEVPSAAAATKPRAVVLTVDRLQVGFIVDSVSEVVSIDQSALSPAPEFSSAETEVFDRVAHIEADGRMLLIVDPMELLSRAEHDVLTALTEIKSEAHTS